jgi:cystathionine beta-lyase/cystathionine gamma-synthase
VCDIRALAEIAHAAGALCLVDNSFMSPIFQRPLELGADISMISGTKFVGGHSDVTCGMLSVSALCGGHRPAAAPPPCVCRVLP